ncbi:unnamed protein product, partial [Medioppia subpectinata]
MLVLTKSVVSTPAHLDIKVRVAQGMSREGWSITKNLMTEITLLTFGFFTFVPMIQKLCLFATVGLLTDFFIQITFFATVLSIDIQRLELNTKPNTNGYTNAQKTHSRHNSSTDNGVIFGNRSYGQNVFARPSKPSHFKMPKRLRVVYFVARTRLVQRALMLILIGWISFLVYNFEIIENLSHDSQHMSGNPVFQFANFGTNQVLSKKPQNAQQMNTKAAKAEEKLDNNPNITSDASQTHRLVHHNPNLWKSLSSQH